MFTAGTRDTIRSDKKLSLKIDSKMSSNPGRARLLFFPSLNFTKVITIPPTFLSAGTSRPVFKTSRNNAGLSFFIFFKPAP
jgi:hypothetical protein